MEKNPKMRIVQQTDLPNGLWISTVFLGLDYNFGDGPPILFESMVFDTNKKEKYKIGDREYETKGEDLALERYHIYDEAEEGHKQLIEKYKDYGTNGTR